MSIIKKHHVLLLFSFFLPADLHAHGGRVDSNGGHTDRSTGQYHKHDANKAKTSPASANKPNSHTKKNEAYYQQIAARLLGGRTEVTMGDGTRCDILNATHAIEVDWGRKWGEAIGQSLNYGFQANKRAGIVLILKHPTENRYAIRVRSIIKHYKLPIDVWVINAYQSPEKFAP